MRNRIKILIDLNKNRKGFNLIELIVASSIIALISVVSVANFHSARKSNEITSASDQLVNSIVNVRNLSLGGQLLTNQTFPAGGYGINLVKNQSQVTTYAAMDLNNNGLDDGEIITSAGEQFSNIKISDLCLLTESSVDVLPCTGDWVNIDTTLEIVFDLSGNVSANDANGQISGAEYVGGVLEHNVTGRQAYFYVSLISGLVVGDLF